MFKYRVIKLITVLTLAVCCLLCNTVYSFAYYPIIRVEDDEYTINSGSTYMGRYPNRVGDFTFVDDVFSDSSLYGKHYYISNYGEDYEYDYDLDVDPPNVTTFTDDCFGAFFRIGSSFYFFYMSSKPENIYNLYVEPVTDSNGDVDYFNFKYYLTSDCRVKLYQLSYPFTSWSKIYDASNTGSSLNKWQTRKWFDYVSNNNYDFIWSSGPLYDRDYNVDNFAIILSQAHGSSYSDIMNGSYTVDLTDTLYLLAGKLSYKITGEQLRCLTVGEAAFVLDDFGIVIGSESTVCFGSYDVTVWAEDQAGVYFVELFNGNFFSDTNINDTLYFQDLNIGDSDFRDIVSFEFLNLDYHLKKEISLEEFYHIELRFLFASDGFNLYFPGTFEIIEFQDYEEEMKHSEVVDSINQATGSITGTISSASDKLSQEITGAIEDLGDEISETVEVKFDELMYGDVPYEKPEYSDDMGDINSQTDSTIDDILSNLDSKALDSLPGGYLDYNSYFTDSIDTLNQTFSPAFMAVRNLFDRFVSVTDIGVLLTFSLIFGFSIFVLGRSLKQ